VETTQPARSPATTQSLTARIGWLVLILATLYACYFSHLGAIGFVGPDEPRYAWIARDMAETGDWITPRLYGKPWFEKPPLYYWGAAFSFKVFGVSEAAARLPSAVSALLATLALAWLALRMYGADTARWLLLLLPTTVGMIGFSHAAATDMPFSAMLTVAMVAAAVLLRLVPDSNGVPTSATNASSTTTSSLSLMSFTSSISFASMLFGFFLGLAVLAKGPAAIILCGGAVSFWALVTKRWRDTLRLLHPAGIIVFSATAFPWYILCARRNPDFFRTFIIEHNFKRFLTPEFQHIQPFWYYVPISLAAVMPWIALFVPLAVSAGQSWRTNRLRGSTKLFFVGWALFTVLFFSVSKSKLPGYILPAVPPIMLLLADLCRRWDDAVPWVRRWTLLVFCATATGLVVGALKISQWNFSKIGPDAEGFPRILATLPLFILLLGVILAIGFGANGRAGPALRMGAATVVASLFTVFYSPFSDLDDLSARRFAKPIYRVQGVAGYELQRSYRYALSFYFHEELQQWVPGDHQFKWVLTDFKNTSNARREGLDCPGVDFTVIWEPIVVCKDLAASAQDHP
jgi:4-amino-4-deoxy-L-arabinose transferase-like glycosyltransferase